MAGARDPYSGLTSCVGLLLRQAGEALGERAALVVVGADEQRHPVVVPDGDRRRVRDRQLRTAVGELGGSSWSWRRAASFPAGARRHDAAVAGSGQPTCLANASPAACAVAGLREAQLPLCMIAPRNSPRAGGEVSSAQTDQPPADSPSIVTLARVAAEGGDVALHPAQRGLLVEEAEVAAARSTRS